VKCSSAMHVLAAFEISLQLYACSVDQAALPEPAVFLNGAEASSCWCILKGRGTCSLEDLEVLASSLNGFQTLVVQIVAAAAHPALEDVSLHDTQLSADGAHSLPHHTLGAVPAANTSSQVKR